MYLAVFGAARGPDANGALQPARKRAFKVFSQPGARQRTGLYYARCAQSRMPFKYSARRNAKATMVKVGLDPDVGKIELPATNKYLK